MSITYIDLIHVDLLRYTYVHYKYTFVLTHVYYTAIVVHRMLPIVSSTLIYIYVTTMKPTLQKILSVTIYECNALV